MKFLIKNARLIGYILIALICVLEIILLVFDVMNPLLSMLLCFVLFVIAILSINVVSIKYLQKISVEFSNTCEPEEYCETLQLFYKGNPKSIPNQINYAASLIIPNVDNCEMARMLMETIAIDRIPEKSASLRYIYYNNLCTIYTALDELDKAENAYQKAIEYLNKIKMEAEKAQQTSLAALLYTGLLIKKGDYDGALVALEKHKETTLLSKVSHALALGEIYFYQNETEKAKEKLSFVVENGSKLLDGQRAKELLKKLS